jgi:fumarate hydratase, class II
MNEEAFRIEIDSMGEIAVPADKMWGACTQRSLENFPIGRICMPLQIVRALALIKKCAAQVNARAGILDAQLSVAIVAAAEEVIAGMWDEHFPLVIWQTGSGTQTNMNVNEVIARRASELSGELVHPNDDVNMSQSSNDVFPTAMHMATLLELQDSLVPALVNLRSELTKKSVQYKNLVKIGRTHLQDATPITLGQEISGWSSQLGICLSALEKSFDYLLELPIGGTAVGTGLNTPEGYADAIIPLLSAELNKPFRVAENRFALQAGREGLVIVSSALKALAVSLHNIASNIRMLASGPRCGIGELILPANEPGSSIMPGKVNPTQIEALCMVCAEVIGNDTKVAFAASHGYFQLNTYLPLISRTVLVSIELLSGAMDSFTQRCIVGMQANEERIKEHLDSSLMLVTALVPHIGYDKAADIAKQALLEDRSLREVALERGDVSEEDFDNWVDVAKMV